MKMEYFKILQRRWCLFIWIWPIFYWYWIFQWIWKTH